MSWPDAAKEVVSSPSRVQAPDSPVKMPMRRPTFFSVVALIAVMLLGAVSAAAADGPAAAADQRFLGRWALDIEDGSPGWLQFEKTDDGKYVAALLWSFGSVNPVSVTDVREGAATLRQEWTDTLHDAAGDATGEDHITAISVVEVVARDRLRVTRTVTHTRAGPTEHMVATGRRSPPLPPVPDLGRISFKPAIDLLHGNSLDGWRLIGGSDAANGWSVVDGVLWNRPTPAAPDQPP